MIPFATLLANDLRGPANESGQTLTIIAVDSAVGGTVALSGTDVTFTPAADFNGTASFRYTVQDNGTTNGVADPKTSTAIVRFTITEVNDAPVANDDSALTNENTAILINVLANRSEERRVGEPANERSQAQTIIAVDK